MTIPSLPFRIKITLSSFMSRYSSSLGSRSSAKITYRLVNLPHANESSRRRQARKSGPATTATRADTRRLDSSRALNNCSREYFYACDCFHRLIKYVFVADRVVAVKAALEL